MATALPVLTGNCAECVGLCCVALPFARSADFPVDKPAGRACRHLQPDYRCGIHQRLRTEGYRGCTTYDCFGAGQRTTAAFAGRSWRDDAATSAEMFTAFGVLRQLHEMLMHLHHGASLVSDDSLRTELDAALGRVAELASRPPHELIELDPAVVRTPVGALLATASEAIRRGAPPTEPRIHRGADLAGADLRGVELRGADLRGALLIRADLRGADLSRTDLLGADLRDADLRGADLRQALFLTGPQLAAATGDAMTTLPSGLLARVYWVE